MSIVVVKVLQCDNCGKRSDQGTKVYPWKFNAEGYPRGKASGHLCRPCVDAVISERLPLDTKASPRRKTFDMVPDLDSP